MGGVEKQRYLSPPTYTRRPLPAPPQLTFYSLLSLVSVKICLSLFTMRAIQAIYGLITVKSNSSDSKKIHSYNIQEK